jgi:hypothetical protein
MALNDMIAGFMQARRMGGGQGFAPGEGGGLPQPTPGPGIPRSPYMPPPPTTHPQFLPSPVIPPAAPPPMTYPQKQPVMGGTAALPTHGRMTTYPRK